MDGIGVHLENTIPTTGSISAPARLRAYLQLTRPANLVTAVADILAGAAVASAGTAKWTPSLLLLVPASVCLYAGGIVFNDYFDRHLDAVERPERALPSGRASAQGAAIFGLVLLLLGIGLALLASLVSGAVATSIAASVLIYDRFSKHHTLAGPVNMGLCRALNLLLGMSVAGQNGFTHWPFLFVPLVYIAAITMLAAGEVHGGSNASIRLTMASVSVVLVSIPLLAWPTTGLRALWALPFLLLLAWRVMPALGRAYQSPQPKLIFAAVKAGVLSLIILDSAITAAHLGPLYGILVLTLTLLAGALARSFQVT